MRKLCRRLGDGLRPFFAGSSLRITNRSCARRILSRRILAAAPCCRVQFEAVHVRAFSGDRATIERRRVIPDR
jgi:hypothetical protein